ncbi:BPTI/Kunitz domain-containing protein-like [Dermacentor silvarum]|uniref:BPTI/Kunitz domain-containing protein-like n=1 Tax=Dermacentor silvarum TaxID=543639 RepID=UPI0021006F7D|nr:BPTI/Kunitz domain-containing protein-like [Dermacentor silvarum]
MKTFVLLTIICITCGIRGVAAVVNTTLGPYGAVLRHKAHNEFTCSDPPDKGPCNESHTRYYFDPQNKTCQEFVYGGCQGNVNNYETHDDCRVNCQLRPRPFCYLPKKRGLCFSNHQRYFYNATSELCELFYYSGCVGNDNNFREIEECQRMCSKYRPA